MSSTNQGPRRVGQWLYLRPESIDEYKKCHAAVWPRVLEQIQASNIRDCASPAPLPLALGIRSDEIQRSKANACVLSSADSIFLTVQPRPTLFASFKYVGSDFDADMKRMAENPTVQEWWRMTDGMQESPVEGAVGSKEGPGWWGQTEEVFYME